MSMVWGFRVGSRREAGAGHVMRCLAVAEALRMPVRFYADPQSPLRAHIAASGFDVVEERSPFRSDRLLADLEAGAIRASLFDGYDFTEGDRQTAAAKGFLAQIADQPAALCGHVVIDPGLSTHADQYRAGSAVILAGADYALLRQQFVRAHGRVLQQQPKAADHLLIAFGAVDSGDATGFVLDALESMQRRPPITVLLGQSAPHFAAVQTKAARLSGVTFAHDIDDMIPLYEKCSLSIGAGGVSLLERLCCGVPSIVITLADNQIPNARAAHAAQAVEYLGRLGEVAAESVRKAVASYAADSSRRAALRQRGLSLVDGRGAERAAEVLRKRIEAHLEHSIPL